MSTSAQVNFFRDAREDIAELAEYFGRFSGISTDDFIDIVFSTLQELAAMPGRGSLKFFRSRRLDGIRSWSVRGYRKILILYRPVDDGIEVIAIAHGARNLKKLLARRLKNP